MAAETLERLFPDRRSELAPQLGLHFAEAGDDERALKYLTPAGDNAYSAFANVEAVGWPWPANWGSETGDEAYASTSQPGAHGQALANSCAPYRRSLLRLAGIPAGYSPSGWRRRW
jgi:hypothetical protein